eukprot:tig00000178_g12730.t1
MALMEEGLAVAQEHGPDIAALQDIVSRLQMQIDEGGVTTRPGPPLESAPSEAGSSGPAGAGARPGSGASQRPGSASSQTQGLGPAGLRATMRRSPSSISNMGGPVDVEGRGFQDAVERAVSRALIMRRGEEVREREALVARVDELASELSLLKAKAARGRMGGDEPAAPEAPKEGEAPGDASKTLAPPSSSGALSGAETDAGEGGTPGEKKGGKKQMTAFAKAAAERRAAEEERLRQIQHKTEEEISAMQRELKKIKSRLDQAEDALDKATVTAEAASRRANATPPVDEFRSLREIVSLHDDELKESRRSIDMLRRDKASAKDMESGLKALTERFDSSPLAAFPALAPRRTSAAAAAGVAAGGAVGGRGAVTDEALGVQERDTVVDVTARRSVEELRRFLGMEMERAEKMCRAVDRKLETKADRLAHEALAARADQIGAHVSEAGDRLAVSFHSSFGYDMGRLESLPALQPREAILTDAQASERSPEVQKADSEELDRALATKIDVAAMDRVARELENLRQSHIQFASKVEQENISSIRYAVEFKADRSDLAALEKRISSVVLGGAKGGAGPRCLSCDRVVRESYGSLEASGLGAPRPPSPPPGGLSPLQPPPLLPAPPKTGSKPTTGKPWELIAEGAAPPAVGAPLTDGKAGPGRGPGPAGRKAAEPRLGSSVSTPELPGSRPVSRPGSAAQLAAAARADRYGPTAAPNPQQRLDLPPSTVNIVPQATHWARDERERIEGRRSSVSREAAAAPVPGADGTLARRVGAAAIEQGLIRG